MEEMKTLRRRFERLNQRGNSSDDVTDYHPANDDKASMTIAIRSFFPPLVFFLSLSLSQRTHTHIRTFIYLLICMYKLYFSLCHELRAVVLLLLLSCFGIGLK